MPSIEWNQHMWGAAYSWSDQGCEWSAAWGGVEAQWLATIFPRIHKFLPARRVLEIAPGYGRWTNYLLRSCETYLGVDFAETCINACRERFSNAPNAAFAVNDGRSLPMVPDASIDFAFSFDSLVHAEADVIESYLTELSRVLAPNGIAFIHHSNLGSLLPRLMISRMLERAVQKIPLGLGMLRRTGIADWDHARAKSMTAAHLAVASQRIGLACVGQEIISWGDGRKMIDCLSLLTRPGSCWDRPNVIVLNPDFMGEASSARRAASIHTSFMSSERTASSVGADRERGRVLPPSRRDGRGGGIE